MDLGCITEYIQLLSCKTHQNAGTKAQTLEQINCLVSEYPTFRRPSPFQLTFSLSHSSRCHTNQTAIQHRQIDTQLLDRRPIVAPLDRLERLQQAERDQRHLRERELLPDADAWARVKREVFESIGCRKRLDRISRVIRVDTSNSQRDLQRSI